MSVQSFTIPPLRIIINIIIRTTFWESIGTDKVFPGEKDNPLYKLSSVDSWYIKGNSLRWDCCHHKYLHIYYKSTITTCDRRWKHHNLTSHGFRDDEVVVFLSRQGKVYYSINIEWDRVPPSSRFSAGCMPCMRCLLWWDSALQFFENTCKLRT